MSLDNIVERISETQDGNPLTKFYRECRAANGTILWDYWDNLDTMSVGDVLNLLLLKIAESATKTSDIDYVIDQTRRARPTIDAIENPPTRVIEGPEITSGKLTSIFDGTCPICHGPDHDFDCR